MVCLCLRCLCGAVVVGLSVRVWCGILCVCICGVVVCICVGMGVRVSSVFVFVCCVLGLWVVCV